MRVTAIRFSGRLPSPDLIRARAVLDRIQAETPGAAVSIGRFLAENGLARTVTKQAQHYARQIGLHPMTIQEAARSREVSEELERGRRLLQAEMARRGASPDPLPPLKLSAFVAAHGLSPGIRESLRQDALKLGLPIADASQSHMGKVESLETREKKSRALKGRKIGPLPLRVRAKLSKALTGREVSDVTRRKLQRAARQRVEQNPEGFRAFGNFWRGKSLPPDVRARISLARRKHNRQKVGVNWSDTNFCRQMLAQLNAFWNQPETQIASTSYIRQLYTDDGFRQEIGLPAYQRRLSSRRPRRPFLRDNWERQFVANAGRPRNAFGDLPETQTSAPKRHSIKLDLLRALKRLKETLPDAFLYIMLSRGYMFPQGRVGPTEALTAAEIAHYFQYDQDEVEVRTAICYAFLRKNLEP